MRNKTYNYLRDGVTVLGSGTVMKVKDGMVCSEEIVIDRTGGRILLTSLYHFFDNDELNTLEIWSECSPSEDEMHGIVVKNMRVGLALKMSSVSNKLIHMAEQKRLKEESLCKTLEN